MNEERGVLPAQVSIMELPDDCLRFVLSFLGLRDVGKFRQTCVEFWRLDGGAWGAARSPTELLREINAAPVELLRWVYAGNLPERGSNTPFTVCVDNRTVPTIWRKEIRELLETAPRNPFRHDAMPAGVTWTPLRTLLACVAADSAEGLAFLEDRGVLAPDLYVIALEESLVARATRVLRFLCSRRRVAGNVLFERAAFNGRDPECLAIIAKHFTLPKKAQALWLAALNGDNDAALDWLAYDPKKFYDYCRGRQWPFRALVLELAGKVASADDPTGAKQAARLRPVFAHLLRDHACGIEANAPVLADETFRKCIRTNRVEMAKLVGEFYLSGDFGRSTYFPDCLYAACCADDEAFFGWFCRTYLREAAGNRDGFFRCITAATPDHARGRIERVFAYFKLCTMFDYRVCETVPATAWLAEMCRRARADSNTRTFTFAFPLDVGDAGHAERSLFSGVFPKTAEVLAAAYPAERAALAGALTPPSRFDEHFDFASHNRDSSSFKALQSFFVLAPEHTRAWIDAVYAARPRDRSVAPQSLSGFYTRWYRLIDELLELDLFDALRLLLRIATTGSPAEWMREALAPHGAVYEKREAFARTECSHREPYEPLVKAAGVFLPDLTYVLLKAASEASEADPVAPWLEELAETHCAEKFRELLRANLGFAAAVATKQSVRYSSSTRWRADGPSAPRCDPWEVCDARALAAACMERFARSSTKWRAGMLSKGLAKKLCAHGFAAHELGAAPVSMFGDVAGFFARRGIAVSVSVVNSYLALAEPRDCVRKFAKLVLRLRPVKNPAHAVRALMDVFTIHWLDSGDTAIARSGGHIIAYSVTIEDVVKVVAAGGCDAAGWPCN